jgi:hypothetical protein
MSTSPVAPVAGTPAPVATPAKPLTAIQILEQELVNFMKQREQAIANVHAVEGAIQAGQHLLAKLKAAAQAAETEAKKLAADIKTDAEKVETAVEADLKKL